MERVQSQTMSLRSDSRAKLLGSDIFGRATPLTSHDGANPFSKTVKEKGFPSIIGKSAQEPSALARLSNSTKCQAPSYAGKAQKSTTSPQYSSSNLPWPSPAPKSSNFPRYYLDADYEALDGRPDEIDGQVTAFEMDEFANRNSGPAEDDAGVFESTLDKAFQSFADRLAHNPLQVLRYEFGGSPLLYSDTDEVGKMLHVSSKPETIKKQMPPCSNCRTARVFELQVTPQAISELEVDEPGLDGMDWGTLIVAVCKNDCLPAGTEHGRTGYIEEWIGAQWEEKSI